MENQTRRETSLGFKSEKVQEGLHICYIFNDDNERQETIAKYLNAGREEGEKVSYFVDTITPDELTDHLKELGVDIRKEKKDINLMKALPAYCPDGSFSSPGMLEAFGGLYRQAIDEGFKGARATGEMSWALSKDGKTRVEDLIDYEARLNHVLQDYPCTACCQYDARKFDGATIMDMLSVHPVMIVRGQLVKNPYYIEPDVFLKEYLIRTENMKTK